MTENKELSEIEQHIVQLIESGLQLQKIDVARAKSIAAAVLAHLKADMTEYQLYQAAVGLSGNFPELSGVAAETGNNYENSIREAVVQHASNLVSQGNLEEAGALLSTALGKKQEIQINE